MILNNVMLRNLSVLFVIIVFSYFSTTYFMNISLVNQSSLVEVKNTFLFQSLIFIFVFVLLTGAFIYYKIKHKKNNPDITKITESEVRMENERLKSSLTVDLLTNLANKKYFEERFEEEYKRAIRDEQHLAFMIVDIDEFRSFNDIYGEGEGNECLKMIANILVSQCSRPCDLVSRINNDEFYILLPNTLDAKTVSQKCVKAVNSMQIPHENSIASNVLTISIGTSNVLPEDIIQKNLLIQNARAALTQAKRAGRNQVA